MAAVLVDRLSDGFSMVYSFYDPDEIARGLGTFMILDHVERTLKAGLPYLYLGYLVEGSPKMSSCRCADRPLAKKCASRSFGDSSVATVLDANAVRTREMDDPVQAPDTANLDRSASGLGPGSRERPWNRWQTIRPHSAIRRLVNPRGGGNRQVELANRFAVARSPASAVEQHPDR